MVNNSYLGIWRVIVDPKVNIKPKFSGNKSSSHSPDAYRITASSWSSLSIRIPYRIFSPILG